MNKKVLGVVVGIISLSSIAVASNLALGDVFNSPFEISLNGKNYTPNLPILNYKDRTYVPLRELATLTGNEVDFKDNSIIINNNENNDANDNEDCDYSITYYNKTIKQYKDDDGNVRGKWTQQYPKISIPNNKVISEKINNEILNRLDVMANEDHAAEIVPMNENIVGYEQDIKLEEYNENYISFVYLMNGSAGGVGWVDIKGFNFNTKTGELLDINKIVNSRGELNKIVDSYLKNEVQSNDDYKDILFSDMYEKIINDELKLSYILDLNSWYLADNDLVINFPKYEIAPGASGIITFNIPKYLIDTMKTEYRNIREF